MAASQIAAHASSSSNCAMRTAPPSTVNGATGRPRAPRGAPPVGVDVVVGVGVGRGSAAASRRTA